MEKRLTSSVSAAFNDKYLCEKSNRYSEDVQRIVEAIPQIIELWKRKIKSERGLDSSQRKGVNSFLSCMQKKLSSQKIYCVPRNTLSCNGFINGYVKAVLGLFVVPKKIYLCEEPLLERLNVNLTASTLIHELSHQCKTKDTAFFKDSRFSPRNVGYVKWYNIASTYGYWVEFGFCLPGIDCPDSLSADEEERFLNLY